jgi:flagellar assembly protein FliH
MSLFDRLRRLPVSLDEFAPLTSLYPARRMPSSAACIFRDLSASRSEEEEVSTQQPAIPQADLEAARQVAYDLGFAAGKAAAEEELHGRATAFAAGVEELARFRSGLLERYQSELLELALGVARKVVQRELAEHPEHWLGMIREGVSRALDRDTIRIRVGNLLHRYLLDNLPQLRALLREVKELDMVEDASLGDMGCVIESHSGDLELGVDNQIDAIRAALTEVG